MTNECLALIANRYSCRDFTDRLPSDEILDAIVTAAIQSPSAVNRQPWQVILVKDQRVIEEIEAASIDYFRHEDPTAYQRIQERGNGIFYNAKSLIVLAIDRNYKDAALLDAGILTQSIVLAAESLGLNTLICGMARTAFMHDQRSEKLKERLSFPEDYDFAVAVLLGYAKTKRSPHEIDRSKITIV